MSGVLVYLGKVVGLLLLLLAPVLGLGFLDGWVFDSVGPYLAAHEGSRDQLGVLAGLLTALPYLVLRVLPLTLRWARGVLWVVGLGLLVDLGVLALSDGGSTESGRANLAGWQGQAGAFDTTALGVHLLVAVPLWTVLYRRWDRWDRGTAGRTPPQAAQRR